MDKPKVWVRVYIYIHKLKSIQAYEYGYIYVYMLICESVNTLELTTPYHRLLEEARTALPALISSALQRGIGASARIVGDVLQIDASDIPLHLAVIPVADPKRPFIAHAARSVRHDPFRHPILVVPHMTPAGIAAAEEERIGWMDLSGNARILTPGFVLHIEGKPNQMGRRGRPASAFGPRGSRVTRALLLEPQRRWRQKELIEVTGLPQGTVSRTLGRLADLGLVERDGDLHGTPVPGELLDAWQDEYAYSRHEIVPVHMSGAGIKLVRELAQRLEGLEVRHAATGLPAAWLLDSFARFRLASVFVSAPPAQVADDLGSRVGEAGANVHLVRPADEGVFLGAQEIEGVPCVHPVQAYIDLTSLGERAQEAAEHLREHVIGF